MSEVPSTSHYPSELAYGAGAGGSIGPNEVLIFKAELLSVVGAGS